MSASLLALWPPGLAEGGKRWRLPRYRFAREQYVDEVNRAVADRSWETPARATARLLADHLRGTKLPGGLTFKWASVWTDGVWGVSYERSSAVTGTFAQELLMLHSDEPDPAEAAKRMVEALLAVDPDVRVATFGNAR